MPMSVCKTYTFAASHQLPNHKGKCARLHGHNYRVEVELTAPYVVTQPGASDEGMILDFDDLDAAVRPIIDALDHRHLNDVLRATHIPPTAEHVAMYIAAALGALGTNKNLDIRLSRVRVWETDKAWAEWRRD